LQIAKEQTPNLILCDINMPKLDGYDVLQELRKDLTTANVPFIFISGEICTPNCRRALQLGANDFLSKPLNNKELLEAIAIQFNQQN
jgi:CheY-like chemotaxis protein